MTITHAYIARCSCGGIVMATAKDVPSCAKETANDVAECIKQGYAIETLTAEEVRSQKWCENHGKCGKEKK